MKPLPRVLASVGTAIAVTPFLGACSDDGDDPAGPQFTSQETTTATGASAPTSASSTPEVQQNETEQTDTTAPTSPEPYGLQEDGTYRLTDKAPGPGAQEDVELTVSDLEDAGFSTLTVDIDTWGQNGFLQYPARPGRDSLERLRIGWTGRGLDGSASIDCSVTTRLLDEEGRDLTERGRGESTVQSCQNSDMLIVSSPGARTVELEIRQPGYEPVRFSQQVLVVE